MGQAKQRGTYAERVAQAKVKQATEIAGEFEFDLALINSNNKSVLEDLKNPKLGFYCAHEWETNDGYVNDGKFSVYMPSLNESDPNYVDPDEMDDDDYSAHLQVYEKAFGGVESQTYNLVKQFENAGKDNPHYGGQTYEPFKNGSYKLCFGIWEPSKGMKQLSMHGGDEVSLPTADVLIFPMLQHGWEEQKPAEFACAYGDKRMLNNLHSMIARANFMTRYIDPFNTNRFKNIRTALSNCWMKADSTVVYNWINTYNASYRMYRSTLGGGNGKSDVKVTIGNRADVVDGALDLHRVFD